ncbi:MAG: hypothetical protein NCW75_12080 [Phycisphaera sp.]|nr:MAG: hypothetical protein NCW75_12080 [Phycisphaera sp.]
MLTITETQTTNDPTPTATPAEAPPVQAGSLRLNLGGSSDAAEQVQSALFHAQRRLDNLRDLIDRFDLDDDDGPRAA